MLAILGAGGHGRVIADVWDGGYRFFDDNKDGYYPLIYFAYSGIGNFIVGIGDNKMRAHIFNEFNKEYSPRSILGNVLNIGNTDYGQGTFINHGAIIQCNCQIGDNAIINTGAQIDHDCVIEAHAHIAPGAVLCGGVHVGEGALVGANATVLPGSYVPAWSTVRAGSLYNENPHEQSRHQRGGQESSP